MIKSSTPISKPQLFPGVEDKTEEALRTFTELNKCWYQNKHLGSSSNEFMECDCFENMVKDKEGNLINGACDEDSECINRLTLIECVDDLCDSTCGKACQNQRFQKREYAKIMVFKTENKGYGVLAQEDIEADQFIYEYISEVVDEEEFRDRMIAYDEERIKHFYFMMLQTGQFIDATKKGCLARFCNHSCNPNAYVNKWVVNGKLKMGIFAKRKIYKDEEVTFDYNVDRYGAVAQKCYCNEPNCIGFLGGKTQTDAASLLPQIFADALGISRSMEKKWLKEKKARGEKSIKNNEENINEEFVNCLEIMPCEDESDVTKVMSALLQIDNKMIALKIFQRLFPVTEESLLHQVIKLHGYKCFSNILKLFNTDELTTSDILEFLSKLPKTIKNGIISAHLDTKINEIIVSFPNLKYQCDILLKKWNSYDTYTRITKKDVSNLEAKQSPSMNKINDLRRVRLPPGWEIIQENGHPVYYNAASQIKSHEPPKAARYNNMGQSNGDLRNESNGTGYKSRPDLHFKRKFESDRQSSKRFKSYDDFNNGGRYHSDDSPQSGSNKDEEAKRLKAKLEEETAKRLELDKIIQEANKQKEQERQSRELLEKARQEKQLLRKQHSFSSNIEYKWNKFFASFVPNMVRKHTMDIKLSHDTVKECSREISKLLTSKETKKDPKATPPSEPSKEKRAKVHHFVKGYMEKFIHKYKQRKHRDSTMTPTAST